MSGLLLACDHTRVDLWGNGAGGSTSFPSRALAGSVSPPFVPSGTTVTPSATITVPPAAPFTNVTARAELTPPIAGGTLTVSADGGVAVAADPDRDALFVVDRVNSGVRGVYFPSGSEPGRVVLDDMRHAHVVLRSADQLARVDLDSMKIMLSEHLCQYPRGVAYEASTQRLHVACADGQIVQLSAADYTVLAREQHELDLRDIVITKGGSRVVSRFRNADLFWRPAQLSQPVAAESTLTAPDLPWPKLSTPAGAKDAELSFVSTTPTFAFRIQTTFDQDIWMLHERAQFDALDADGHYNGQDTGCGPVVQPALSQFKSRSGELQTSVNLQLQGIAAPAVDFALSGNASWVAIATPSAYAARRATLQLQQLDLLQKQAKIPVRDVGSAEFQGSTVEVCALPSFIPLEFGSQAVAVAFDEKGLLYVQSRFPARLDVYEPVAADPGSGTAATTRLVSATDLSPQDDDPRDLGQEWFHAELGTSQLSCAACHAEGLDDAHTWISGTKSRRTPSLRGGLTQTAPFFWGGEFGSFDALLSDVVTRQFSAPRLSAEASEAMLAWLDRLPALSLVSVDPAAERGRRLFESQALGCVRCHGGAAFTNNLSVDWS